jgi:uncharacterized protein
MDNVGGRQLKESKVSNTQTVQQIYEAFGRGDVPTILDKLDDSIEWETQAPVPGVAWLQSRRGRTNVAGFFEALAPLTITRFQPHTFFDGGNKICVLIAFDATNHGRHYSFPNNGHLWEFSPVGKIIRFDHVTDTAQMIRLAQAQ